MKMLLMTFLLLLSFSALTVQAKSIEVVDFRDKVVRLKRPPDRIVCLIESALSGIYMLGQGHRVIGISENVYHGNVYQYYSAIDKRIENKELPAPGNWDFISLEGIIALRPDLVIMWAQQTEAIEAIEKAGIPVFGVFLDSIKDIFQEIDAFGVLTQSEKRAHELITYTKNEINLVANRVKHPDNKNYPSVYYLWAQSLLNTSCKGSIVDDLIVISGGRNICTERKEHAVISMERLISEDPEVILMWHNERLDREDIIGNKQLKTVRAIRNKRVYELPEVFLCDLWTLKFQYALKLTAKWLHPELFHDLDIHLESDAMFKVLYGKSF